MFQTIAARVPRDRDYPDRVWRLDVLARVLDGTFYDVLPHPFHEERTPAGEYIPLRARRPSVRTGLARTVVEDSASLLFDEGHFPTIDCPDPAIRAALSGVIKENRLNWLMLETACRGAIGSAAICMRVLPGRDGGDRVFFQGLDTRTLSPVWDPAAPDTLLSVRECYKVRGAVLEPRGYTVDPNAIYWFARTWDAERETWFLPWPVTAGQDTEPQVDPARSQTHGLGFVPVVWIRNLPGGDEIDGAPTVPPDAIATIVEIDYHLSQLGRGLKYSADPTLLIKEPSPLLATGGTGSGGATLVKGGDNAILVGKDGDAKLLEINGAAAGAVIDYVRLLREMALESAHGNRANPDKISAAQSGRAMELLNESLIRLADKLRVSYGEGGLLDLLGMVCRASTTRALVVRGQKVGRLHPDHPLALKWPRWYAPTADDRQKDANTLKILLASGIISRETALQAIAPAWDIEDVKAELARIAADAPPAPPSPSAPPGTAPAGAFSAPNAANPDGAGARFPQPSAPADTDQES